MNKLLAFAIVAASCAALISCDDVLRSGCSGVGYNAVRVSILDGQGKPQALGAVVTLYDGTYQERDSSIFDAYSVNGAQERGGRTYDIQVSKTYYQDVWVRGVKAPGGGCVTGQESNSVPLVVPVTLSLAAGAPAVRSLRLLPPSILLDRAPYTTSVTYTPVFDADANVSRTILWRISGDTSSVLLDATSGTLQYRCRATSGIVTVTAKAAADTTVFAQVVARVQGHPNGATDAPCS